jgi:predicted GNAT family acetyltransferase
MPVDATDPLLRPIWSALTTRQANLALGDAVARRYPAEFAPFAATSDDSPASLAALRPLIPRDGGVALFTAAPIPVPVGLSVIMQATALQMAATSVEPPSGGLAPTELAADDLADMAALVDLTRPGPFAARTRELGTYLGIRVDGRLVAMAGERMRADGVSEISAVCTHPDHRGQGHARRVVAALANLVLARGERPFLHVFDGNAPAIALYRQMGFAEQRRMHLTVLRHAAPAQG